MIERETLKFLISLIRLKKKHYQSKTMAEKFIPSNKFKSLYYKAQGYTSYIREFLFPPQKVDYKDIPIIINNFNRLDNMKDLIAGLESRGYFNIYIIDNNSTYPPLLEYYTNCKYPVFRLDTNVGNDALWRTEIGKKFFDNYFVYTDSDVVLLNECPDDFMKVFMDVMKKHKLAQKVGFSLKLDDIPDCNTLKKSILDYEGVYYKYYDENENLYRAPIATTFALYRPRGKRKHANNYIENYRTGHPYMARHMPWYHDSLNPDAEEKYYLEHLHHSTFWTTRSRKVLESK